MVERISPPLTGLNRVSQLVGRQREKNLLCHIVKSLVEVDFCGLHISILPEVTVNSELAIRALPEGCYVMLHIQTQPSPLWRDRNIELITGRGDRFELGADLWIEKLDEGLAMNVMEACEPPDYRIRRARQDNHLYAFVKRASDDERGHEGSELLHTAVALSRLVHPTSTGDRYIAKVFHYGLPESPIFAIRFRGISPDVFLSLSERDWLSVDDGETLRRLMPWALKRRKMHDRIYRAFWYHEHAMRIYHLDVRWPIVVTGLEALVNTGKNDNKVQFCQRLSRLAEKLQIELSADELKKAWDLRSKLLHAEGFLYGLDSILPQAEHSHLYDKLETLLRVTVRQSLLDENFGNIFLNNETVRTQFPVSMRGGSARTRSRPSR